MSNVLSRLLSSFIEPARRTRDALSTVASMKFGSFLSSDDSQKANSHLPRVLLLNSHKDRRLADELHQHLRLLDQNHICLQRVDILPPGAAIVEERLRRLTMATIVLALLSVDFFSDPLYGELLDLIRRGPRTMWHPVIIPVPLRPSEWRATPLGAFQSLPIDGEPITLAPDREVVWASIAESVRTLRVRTRR